MSLCFIIEVAPERMEEFLRTVAPALRIFCKIDCLGQWTA